MVFPVQDVDGLLVVVLGAVRVEEGQGQVVVSLGVVAGVTTLQEAVLTLVNTFYIVQLIIIIITLYLLSA